MVHKFLEDFSAYTSIPEKKVERILKVVEMIIEDSVFTDYIEDNDTTDIDIGIGTLSIIRSIDNNTLKFRFVPSAKLEGGVRDTVIKGVSPIDEELCKNLPQKIKDCYKEL